MHAVMVTVRLDPARADEVNAGLHEFVMPHSQKSPGFASGTWFGDDASGHGLVLFDTEEHARSMAAEVQTGPDDPVQIEKVEVWPVVGQA